AGREVAAKEIGIGEAEIDLLGARRKLEAEPRVVASPEEVALAQADIAERPVRRREAAAHGQRARRLLLDIDRDDGAIGRAALRIGDIDLLEEAEIADALLRTPQLRGVERIALDEAEFAPDHRIEGAHVAGDIDTLDEDARTLLHIEGDVDGARLAVTLDLGADVDEGEALVAERIGDAGNRLLDLVSVIPVALLDRHQRLQLGDLYILDLALDIDLAEAVAVAL